MAMQAPASSGTSASTTSSATVAAAISPGSSQFQRLKVEDALSYLDQVKLQFGNQPQVYNDFLDIMKEFKSQSIDTPGVISRVSNLFKGHPDLIVGFNTFLPPGFKIEVHGTNEINISGPAQHTHTLQQIAMRHNSSVNSTSQSSQVQSSGGQSRYSTPSSSTSPSGAGGAATATSGTSAAASAKPASSRSHSHQPVEFNHAINYVNKIKNRFQGQPDVYKAFLEILHTYQKEQRGAPQVPLTETEVYAQVSKLFQNQEDLLAEFGQFLPDATSAIHSTSLPVPTKKHSWTSKGSKTGHTRKSSQSSASNSGQPPAKKPKNSAKDILTEAGKHGNYAEMALFDKVRKALHSQEVYDNFLRCLVLFNEEIVSRQELIHLVQPFLGKFPDLLVQFKTLLGFKEPSTAEVSPDTSPPPAQFPTKDRVTEFAAEIDFNSLKRHGASYRALPKTFVQPKCSGRTLLCKEVLNDTWVSFPMWSEDSTFQGTRKTQYEECIFRCEDERFELDIVLETNLSTIKVLEAIQKKMGRMNPDELAKFTLDNKLGGDSEFIHRKAIYRIYGDKAGDIIDGLKKSPSVGLPVVLKRLKGKQEEWLEAQRAFNKSWRENLEKYYLKSLDHQGIHFKTTDTRAMRSKTQISEIESLYDERQEQLAEGKATPTGAHLTFSFPSEQTVYNDAVALVMYYMKKASSLSRDESVKIKYFLIHTLADFCYHNRVELIPEDDLSADSDTDSMEVDQKVSEPGALKSSSSSSLHPDPPSFYSDLDSHVIFTNNAIYVFFRLFQFLCERLNRVHHQALVAIEEEGQMGGATLQESTAIKLGLKKMSEIHVDQYYPTFLNMAKALMEGNIDCSSYEDTCREMFGVHAYVVFTVDRLVQNIVRQLHTMVADDSCSSILEQYTCFVEGLSSEGPGHVAMETSYQKKMESTLADENCFKVVMTKNRKFTIELLESEESSDDNGPEAKRWSNYLEQLCRDEPILPADVTKSLSTRRIFLKRNHRSPSLLTGSEQERARMLEDVMTGYDAHGAVEFKLDDRSYRMIPLANSGDYMYRRGSLSRAKQVTPAVTSRKHSRFEAWYNRWSDDNVSTEDRQSCRDWFLGHSDHHQPQPETHSGTSSQTDKNNHED